MSKNKITRRDFMKVGFSCFMGAAASTGVAQQRTPENRGKSVTRTSLRELTAIPTTCEQCPAGCGVIAYLDGDRLVQILGNPEHPSNGGGICAKGIAGLNLANDPERLLYPMKREGRRGEGKWTRITWDEAYHRLGERLYALRSEGKTAGFVCDRGSRDPLLDMFLRRFGTDSVIDRPALKNWNRHSVLRAMTGEANLLEDVANSRMILNFGANPFANHDLFIALARRIMHARTEKGTRLVTFDVRMSETAAKSDEWHPLRSGTDGLVALAMAKVMLEMNLIDTEFLEKYSDITPSRLQQHLSPYTLGRAEKESGIKASVIRNLAAAFATQKPSLAIFGGGVTDHENGVANAGCILLLNLLAGNLERKGGFFWPKNLVKGPAPFGNAERFPPLDGKALSSVRGLSSAGRDIDTYFLWMSNPVYDEPEGEEVRALLEDEATVPFIAAMDTHLTETALLADLVLPAATYLEGWGLRNGASLEGYPFIALKQPVLTLISPAKALRSPDHDAGKLLDLPFQPRGEAKEIGNFCLDMNRMMAGNKQERLSYRDSHDFVLKTLASLPGFDLRRDLGTLKSRGFWSPEEIPGISYGQNSAGKSKGKQVNLSAALFSDSGRKSLPAYQPISLHTGSTEKEFFLTTFKPNTWATGTANSKWIREILHENPIWIHGETADRMGIKSGDRVRVVSKAGILVTRALRTERIHPQSVALAAGLGHKAIGKVAKAKPFQSQDQDTRLLWWAKKGNGVNPNPIIARESHSLGGGRVFKDTKVRIEKIWNGRDRSV